MRTRKRPTPARGVRAAGGLALLLPIAAGPVACERPAEPTGRALYMRHCASCHGEDGRGQGPVAASLATPPADLTGLARRRDGVFDERELVRIVDGRHLVAAHGPREMPVWGAVFDRELADEAYGSYTTLLHAQALVEYLRTLQRP